MGENVSRSLISHMRILKLRSLNPTRSKREATLTWDFEEALKRRELNHLLGPLSPSLQGKAIVNDQRGGNVCVSEIPGEICIGKNTKDNALSHFKEPGPLWDLLAIQVIKICSKLEKYYFSICS